MGRQDIEGIKYDKEKLGKLRQENIDMMRKYEKVFNTPAGKEVLANLENVSRRGFPYFEKYRDYSKIGQQKLVDYMRDMIRKAKEIK